MLILSRNPDESIMIQGTDGEVIKVKVIQVKGKNVRLGIDAHEDVVVHREEIYDKIKRESETG